MTQADTMRSIIASLPAPKVSVRVCLNRADPIIRPDFLGEFCHPGIAGSGPDVYDLEADTTPYMYVGAMDPLPTTTDVYKRIEGAGLLARCLSLGDLEAIGRTDPGALSEVLRGRVLLGLRSVGRHLGREADRFTPILGVGKSGKVIRGWVGLSLPCPENRVCLLLHAHLCPPA